MKPFLVIQLRPEDATSNSEFESIIKATGLHKSDIERLRAEHTGLPLDLNLNDYSGVIVGGSPYDLLKPEAEKSEAQKKIEADFKQLLAKILDRDFPFLGACSGCGLLGRQTGTTISKKYGETIHEVTLHITEDGKNDPLLKDQGEHFKALLGHKEACDGLPRGALLLVTGDDCPIQMYRLKENVYGTQFHPEAYAEDFAIRIKTYKNSGYCSPEDAQSLIDAVKDADTPVAHDILRRFVNRYRKES